MNLISRLELRDKLDRQDEFKLLMTLSAHAYADKHIPTSLHAECVEDALAVLDPVDEVVVYCADARCAASIYAYHVLEREGFTRLRRYAGGIVDWEDAGYPLESGSSEGPRAERPTSRAGRQRPWRPCA
jgi:rhodanese-related sulfurtransferase